MATSAGGNVKTERELPENSYATNIRVKGRERERGFK